MADKQWKQCERAIARLLGGERVPITGRARGDTPDIAHNRLNIECKSRKKLPDWLHDAMDQAEAAGRDNQFSVVILHEVGRRHADDLVLMRLSDLRVLLASLPL